MIVCQAIVYPQGIVTHKPYGPAYWLPFLARKSSHWIWACHLMVILGTDGPKMFVSFLFVVMWQVGPKCGSEE